MKHGDFLWFFVCLPEGITYLSDFPATGYETRPTHQVGGGQNTSALRIVEQHRR